ncbi:MAG: DUF4266 domain-containing protein [Saprospiraceae bacterium]|nr:DUF4266 domain-containing protein [Saprospiraceae bacterium]MCB0624635.1 DUF4266 domain-containing protein [Saprospiraceae bacterium]MCB0677492.1 DUF4266 domain-containing protein [Saprospiraceae bacterium]MCB0682612.1 DUF4266 domain-containing protein [Saprospiraceae bacterium]
MKTLCKVLAGSALLWLASGCVSVKAYQKMYLNDSDMALSAKKGETFEINFEAYREGAAGANGGKVGGGCGCN